ncbi:hypothetical protein EDD15DRAFT_1651392 [Pisolithus albus]|nr:hypothetical protein EDD15DRAFT_1651392 [Pisolithus albus]
MSCVSEAALTSVAHASCNLQDDKDIVRCPSNGGVPRKKSLWERRERVRAVLRNTIIIASKVASTDSLAIDLDNHRLTTTPAAAAFTNSTKCNTYQTIFLPVTVGKLTSTANAKSHTTPQSVRHPESGAAVSLIINGLQFWTRHILRDVGSRGEKKCCGTLSICGLDMQARQANFHRADLDPAHLPSRELVPPRISHKSASMNAAWHRRRLLANHN